MLNKKIILAAIAVSFMLLSGCALYGTTTIGTGPGAKSPDDMLNGVKAELKTCGGSMAFGTSNLPCCNNIDALGKCTDLAANNDPGITYGISSSHNPHENCNIDRGTCEMINLDKWNTSAGKSTAKLIENQTINLCPTFVRSVCMENCTTGVFRDITFNENPGLSPGDIHQLRLIYSDNGTQIANHTNDNSINVKRLNLLYSEGSYQAIDAQVAKDLKASAVMDIFRFGVGKSFADFDEARLILPFSSEETGEVLQSGVESFPLYYYPKAAIQNCAMDLADYGYKCNNVSSGNANGKVFPTFEMPQRGN